jgi:TRAP-type C4-dicarboxylate transport system permease large subunit
LGIIVTIAVEIGMITPPVGLNLFVLKGIVPKEVTMADIMAGSVPFILVMLVGLLVIVLFPQIALWLPQMMGK